MTVKLLTEHHLEFLSLKGGCTGSFVSTVVKMPYGWKSHVMAHFIKKDKFRLVQQNKGQGFQILRVFAGKQFGVIRSMLRTSIERDRSYARKRDMWMKRTKWMRMSKYFLDDPHYFYDHPHLNHILLSVLYIKQNLLTFTSVRKLH